MLIILREDLKKVGKAGDIVRVKDGYARNFLIPQKMAYPATDAFINRFNEETKSKRFKEMQVLKTAKNVKAALENVVAEFKVKVGEDGKLFGSVTAQNIADVLAEKGIEIDRRKLQLEENIKTLGEFKIGYKYHQEVAIEVNVKVVDENPAKEEE